MTGKWISRICVRSCVLSVRRSQNYKTARMDEIAPHRSEHILNQIWTSLKIKNEVVDITKAGRSNSCDRPDLEKKDICKMA